MTLTHVPFPSDDTGLKYISEANALYAKLTDKQKLFVMYYLGVCNFNATNAAEMAGYKHKNRYTLGVTASIVKNHSRVKYVVEAYMQAELMVASEHATHLTRLARGVPEGPLYFMDKVIVEEFNSRGEVVKVERYRLNYDRLKEHGHLVKGIKFDPYGQPLIEFHDRLRALDMVGKQHLELGTGGNGLNIKTEVSVQTNQQTGLVILPSKDDGGIVPPLDIDEKALKKIKPPKTINNNGTDRTNH